MQTQTSTRTVVLGYLVAASVLVTTGAGRTLADGPAEKLILGFEKTELARTDAVSREEKPGRDSWFYLLDRPEGFDFAARFEWPGATNRAWTWRCRPGTHTQGELALVTRIGPANPQKLEPTYERTAFLSRFYPDLRSNREAYRVMTSFQWLAKADPSLRDWSGYERLWIDVRCETSTAELWLGVEDDLVEPPVMRTFHVPASRWVTLEVDLTEAARTRGLDLGKIANFWLFGRAPARAEIRIDNIRLVTKAVQTPAGLLRDEQPLDVESFRAGRPEVPKLPAGLESDRAPLQLGKPVVVASGSVVPFGWVAAYDNRSIIVAYSAQKSAAVVCTNDGGQTWQKLPDPTARNLDHGTARGSAIDGAGDGVAISSGPGCAGLGQPAPRQHLTKYTFTGAGWRAERTTILDSDIRHCASNAAVVRLRRGPHTGRLWASWGTIDRSHRMGVHAKLSDNDGRTWLPWGRGAGIPGATRSEWSDGTYGYPETVITPYGDHVACFWRHKRRVGVLWSTYDGTTWSDPVVVSTATLDRMDGSYRATMSAVTRGEREVFFTATGLETVMRWDGKTWSPEPIAIEDGGMLSLAGDTVTLFTAGRVNRRWQGLHWPRRTTVRFHRRQASGSWESPVDLTGEFDIHEYRSMAGFSVPPYSPANFVPLVWSDHAEGTVKLLRVPVGR